MPGDPILIVDDNPANLKLARVVLASEGFDVRTAVDAEQAVEVLATFLPKLILMDIQLPGMDGLELTRRLKADARYRGVVILALTAYAMKGDDEKAIAAGCDGYIAKPLDVSGLPTMVADWIARGPLARSV
jgi:CheY-like chemotaxis protein